MPDELNLAETFQDPEFHKMPLEHQLAVLRKGSADWNALDPKVQGKILGHVRTKAAGYPNPGKEPAPQFITTESGDQGIVDAVQGFSQTYGIDPLQQSQPPTVSDALKQSITSLPGVGIPMGLYQASKGLYKDFVNKNFAHAGGTVAGMISQGLLGRAGAMDAPATSRLIAPAVKGAVQEGLSPVVHGRYGMMLPKSLAGALSGEYLGQLGAHPAVGATVGAIAPMIRGAYRGIKDFKEGEKGFPEPAKESSPVKFKYGGSQDSGAGKSYKVKPPSTKPSERVPAKEEPKSDFPDPGETGSAALKKQLLKKSAPSDSSGGKSYKVKPPREKPSEKGSHIDEPEKVEEEESDEKAVKSERKVGPPQAKKPLDTSEAEVERKVKTGAVSYDADPDIKGMQSTMREAKEVKLARHLLKTEKDLDAIKPSSEYLKSLGEGAGIRLPSLQTFEGAMKKARLMKKIDEKKTPD